MSLNIKNAKFCKVWEIEDTKYGKRFRIGSSRKYNGEYINSTWYNVRFVGEASVFADTLKEKDTIDILEGQIENVYNAEKKVSYINLTVFKAQRSESFNNGSKKDEEEYPF